jgi:SAM-dependent methyltransferase
VSIHQVPSAYLLGLEGVALLRAFSGEYDEDFTRARLAEVKELLESADEVGKPFTARPLTTVEGYAAWASTYDQPGNGCFPLDEPVISEMLQSVPADGKAVDVACGTGRLSRLLLQRGHAVVGVDSSPDMLSVARRNHPLLDVLEGDVRALPLDTGAQDVVVCGLALSHLPDLRPVFSELARVLRPGGHLIVSDIRGFLDTIRPPTIWRAEDGTFRYLPIWVHRTSHYLSAALAVGLHVLRCEEPVAEPLPMDDPSWQVRRPVPPGQPPNVWELMGWCPAAAHAAFAGCPGAIVWHFQLGGTS